MLTVILLSEHTERLLARWRELFVPFEEQGLIAFCVWHQGDLAQSLEQAVPDLGEAIKGKDEWRALVLGTGIEHVRHGEYLNRENPFDFEGGTASGPGDGSRSLAPSAFPLVRLTHMLLGYPELGPRAFEPDPSFRDRKTEQTRYLSEFLEGASDEDARQRAMREFSEALAEGHHPQIHYRVIEPSAEEIAKHSELSTLYEARQTRPVEVIAVATRVPKTEGLRNDLSSSWAVPDFFQPSLFVDRNAYPASCRFVVFDMKPEGHASIDLEELRFVLGTLTLAANGLPASGLQSDRLYRLDVKFDAPLLADFLNHHLGSLWDVLQYVNKRLETIEVRPRPPETEVLTDTAVTVDFDRLRGEHLRVSEAGYSLATDRPSMELERWRSSHESLTREVSRFNREPSRALAESVTETRLKMRRPLDEIGPLSPIDVSELEEDLARRSQGLVRRVRSKEADPGELRRDLAQHDRRIRKMIQERLTARSIVIILAVAIGAWVAALLPYVIKAALEGGINVGESFLLSAALIGIILLAAYAVLESMRRQLLALLRSVNADLRAYVTATTRAAQEYAAYLSELVTYTLGRRRLLAEQQRIETERKEQQRLKRLQRRIEARIDLEKSLVKSVDCPIQVQRGSYAVSELERFGLSRAERILLWTPGLTQCEFNQSGDKVEAPYPFITRLSIQPLPLKDPVAPHGTAIDGDPHDHQSDSGLKNGGLGAQE